MQQNLPQFDADLRRQQTEDARRMVESDDTVVEPRPTLTVRTGFVRPVAKVGYLNDAPRVEQRALRTDGKRFPAGPRPAPLKGHEAFLKALEFNGATLIVEKASSGLHVTGVIKHSDKFTVTLRTTDETSGTSIDRVVFKHDISEFYTITPRPDKATTDAADESLAA